MIFGRQLEIAVDIWREIRQSPQPADRWLANFFHRERKRFGSKDRRFYAETVYALFRHKNFLTVWASEIFPQDEDQYAVFLAIVKEALVTDGESIEFAKQSGLPLTRELIQDLRLYKLPSPVEKSRLNETELLSLRFSFPEWLIARWTRYFGIGTCRKLLEICQKRPPFTVRINPLKISRPVLMERFAAQGLKTAETPRSSYGITFEERANLFDSEEFREGLFEVQDEGSQLLCLAMEPQPGELIWDACAGGGGKSLLIAALMKNKGRVVATDIREKKLEELAKRAKRAGIFNIFPADLNRMSEMAAAKKGFDKILVDAPCSGTGTLRRNPDAKWKLSEERILACKKEQLSILKQVTPYLKKGGRLYYATCSLEPEENEEVMKAFLDSHPGLVLVPSAGGGSFLRLFPHEHQTDGFFLGIAENRKQDPTSL